MIDQSRHGCFGLAGYSGAGKTSLAERSSRYLLPGHNVASIKHAHHHFDPDTPGKDSWRHRKAGASQMLISSALRRVKFTETPDKNEAGLPALLEEQALLILCWSKGSRRSTSPRSKSGGGNRAPLLSRTPGIRMVASDTPLDCPLPVLDLNDAEAIASAIEGRLTT